MLAFAPLHTSYGRPGDFGTVDWGVMCIIYTLDGGIRVIWTDVIQGLLLSVKCAILIFIVICLKVRGGIGEILR